MLPRCKSCRLECLRCSWTNYFKFSVTAIAKLAPAITTYGGSSFHNEVGTCYCRQIRYLIVNDAFKWTILRVRYHLLARTFTLELLIWCRCYSNKIHTPGFIYRMFLLTKCFVICEKWLWNVLLDCFNVLNCQESRYSDFSAHKEQPHKHARNLALKWLRCQWGLHRYAD